MDDATNPSSWKDLLFARHHIQPTSKADPYRMTAYIPHQLPCYGRRHQPVILEGSAFRPASYPANVKSRSLQDDGVITFPVCNPLPYFRRPTNSPHGTKGGKHNGLPPEAHEPFSLPAVP